MSNWIALSTAVVLGGMLMFNFVSEKVSEVAQNMLDPVQGTADFNTKSE